MNLNLKGKSVIVTASSKGLGKATALEFAKEGAHVMISSRDEQELKKTVEEIQNESGNDQVDYAVCDVTKPDQIKQLVQKAVNRNGTVDVLINNAGGPPPGQFEQFSDGDWQNAFELNLLSFIRTIREVLPYMKQQNSGRIINFASSSIKQTLDNLLLSNTFRAGIVGLAKGLSQELAPHNILINTLGPGRIGTDRLAQLDQSRADQLGVSSEEVKEQTEATIPIGRYGTPDEFAKVAVFLGSGANTYVTGQSLVVDGGLVKAL
ncbi:SDR family oxidoreductase [Filobacillus milosensis]|uniref:SDR family oxidoreductase n=1 Tax=Filobacillus milosensis TaxID=94137 RepID=A0A4Y8IEP6_9BACI|nr:SDR family oxidoreductase [Filobacillus milosensis]TFB14630.1 SDR family oxidoreductase [Filobacillus milosensis]